MPPHHQKSRRTAMSQTEKAKQYLNAFGLRSKHALLALMMVFIVVFASIEFQTALERSARSDRDLLASRGDGGAPVPSLPVPPQFKDDVDADNNKKVTAQELAEQLKMSQNEADAVVNKYARTLDEGEFNKYIADQTSLFALADKNNDGQVTAEELAEVTGLPVAEAKEMIRRVDGVDTGSQPDGNLDQAEFSELKKQQIEPLQFDDFVTEKDGDKDGKLTYAELGPKALMSFAEMSKYDRNGDRELDREEFAKLKRAEGQ